MRTLMGWIMLVALNAILAWVPAYAQAQAEEPEPVDCVSEQAIAEGVRKIGAAGGKLLGKLGLSAPHPKAEPPAAKPCPPPSGAATAPAQPAASPRFKLGGVSGKSGQRNCGALGAGCADGMNPLVACMAEMDGYLWKALADAIELKREQSTDLSAQQLSELSADVSALREAHSAGAARVAPVDPARPDRYNTWLSSDEYSVVATAASQTMNSHREACNAKHARF